MTNGSDTFSGRQLLAVAANGAADMGLDLDLEEHVACYPRLCVNVPLQETSL